MTRAHHELKVWRAAVDLTERTYRLTASFPREEIFGLTSQMRRSAVSVPCNIAEGAARGSDKDFARFLLIARGSLSELETQIVIVRRLGYLDNETAITEKIDEVFALLGGLLNRLRP